MANYLLELKYDCNDGDYIYGLMLLNEEQKTLVDKCLEKDFDITVGGDLNDNDDGEPLSGIISVREISDLEADVLKGLKLDNFGECNKYFLEELKERLDEE